MKKQKNKNSKVKIFNKTEKVKYFKERSQKI